MRLDSYSRQDLIRILWRVFSDMGNSVRVRIAPRHKYLTIVVELKEELEHDEVILLEAKDWGHYDERRPSS